MQTLEQIVAGYNEKSLAPAETVFDNMFEYSDYVVKSRAIPDVRDGFKPVHRIALWVAMANGRGKKRKTIGLVGEMMSSGLYHHGDAPATAAINMIAGPFVNNRSILHGHGAFGTMTDPKSFGASRYTSVSVSDFSHECFLQDEELLEMVQSIDGDAEMCDCFLPLIPTVLLNGSSGMAVAFSTDILPHSVEDLKAATLRAIDGKPVGNINPSFESYDREVVPLGGLSYNVSGKVNIINTTTVEIVSNNPNWNQEKLKTHLFKLIEQGHISSFEDRTAKTFSVVVKMSRSKLNEFRDNLPDLFKLRAKMTERLVTIGLEKTVRIYKDHDELIKEWVNWRFAFYKKRYERLLKIEQDQIDMWRDIIRCSKEGIQEKLRTFKDKAELAAWVKTTCEGRNRPQIVEMSSYRWTLAEIAKVSKKITASLKTVALYDEIIKSDDKRRKIFKDEIKSLKG